MATSPIYSWPEPDNTDLVKNGALAIRTLGNAIDTTMGTMTPKSIVDAKGDLIAASANDTPARLAVGANGTTLIADSSTSTGLRYQSSYNANGIINGGYDIAQRGTSINTAGGTFAYTLDRLWVFSNGPAVTTSQQVTGDTTNLPNIQYCARLQRQSGQTGTLATVWNMPLETRDSIRFAGQTVTFSYYARKSATYTATLTSSLLSGTGTDQSGLGGFTGQAVVATFGATLTNTWQRFQGTGTVGATATGIRIEFSTNSWVGTAGAADYVEITGVQLELGSVATSFKRAGGGTIQQELDACQRYYETSFDLGQTPASNGTNQGTVFIAANNGGFVNNLYAGWTYKVTKRATPTVTLFNPVNAGAAASTVRIYSVGGGGADQASGVLWSNTQEFNQNITVVGSLTSSMVSFAYSASAEL